MNYYFLKLNGPRPTFAMDMTEEERNLMQQHAAYWSELQNKDRVPVFGLVMDPAGPYGMGVAKAEGEDAIRDLSENDPVIKANRGFRYDIFPMRAVVKE